MVLLHQAATAAAVEFPVSGDENEPPVSVPESNKPNGLSFVSLTIVSSPNHNVATVKVDIDGETKTFDHNGGVGPVDAICGALRELAPDFQVLHCRTEELGPGSQASAKAQVQIALGGFEFDGFGENPDTLVATAIAIIDAINRVRKFKRRLGSSTPVLESGGWAGFLIDEIGGTRNKGQREIGLFKVSFDGNGMPIATFGTHPTSAQKKRHAKAYHHEKKYALCKTRTTSGDTCHLFLESGGNRHCQLPHG